MVLQYLYLLMKKIIFFFFQVILVNNALWVAPPPQGGAREAFKRSTFNLTFSEWGGRAVCRRKCDTVQHIFRIDPPSLHHPFIAELGPTVYSVFLYFMWLSVFHIFTFCSLGVVLLDERCFVLVVHICDVSNMHEGVPPVYSAVQKHNTKPCGTNRRTYLFIRLFFCRSLWPACVSILSATLHA